jgi:beta-aspartyl-peptidase (threonine type)
MKTIRVTTLALCLLFATGSFAFHLAFSPQKAAAEKQAAEIEKCTQRENFVLVIHGGAGHKEYKLKERAAFIKDLLIHCKRLLHDGETSLDVVHFAIKEMEDSGLFNAGKGSIKNKDGIVEMDASIMDGKNMRAGAVASVSRKIKNPITAAKLILETSDNVMFVGENAEKYVKRIGSFDVDIDPKDRFGHSDAANPHGTVGCVALDRCGNLAAGTSTGGFGRKIPGRVGDSPIIGAGTYANDRVAVSCTGHGEYFIRWAVAHDVAALYAYKNLTIADAAKQALDKIQPDGGTGGIIALDSAGNIATPFNTKRMIRGRVSSTSEPRVAIY